MDRAMGEGPVQQTYTQCVDFESPTDGALTSSGHSLVI